MSTEEEVAALRLMLREVATLDATGIDYALRCQRERDHALAQLAAAQRELHRLSCGEAIESDGLCPEGIRAEGHRAWSRLWHREARRLWREVASTRAGALREAADIARAHGGISAYYAIAKLAAEVEP